MRRSFRLGLLHARTGEFIPFVSVGLARDGGVFVSPVDLAGESWMQGPIAPGLSISQQPQVSTSVERPKLHYHRSGIVRASLSGSKLVAATSTFEPMFERTVGTLISIVVTEPFKLPRQEFRAGDIATIEGDWPATATNSIAVIQPSSRVTSLEDEEASGLAPIGLVSQTPSQAVVDLRGYGHSALLLVDGGCGHVPVPGEGPTITITAYPESPDGKRPSKAHALWNASARNPLLGYQEDFLWEADRESWAYRSAYIARFNRFPPWERISGTHLEQGVVPLVRLWRHMSRAWKRRAGSDANIW